MVLIHVIAHFSNIYVSAHIYAVVFEPVFKLVIHVFLRTRACVFYLNNNKTEQFFGSLFVYTFAHAHPHAQRERERESPNHTFPPSEIPRKRYVCTRLRKKKPKAYYGVVLAITACLSIAQYSLPYSHRLVHWRSSTILSSSGDASLLPAMAFPRTYNAMAYDHLLPSSQRGTVLGLPR